MPFLTAKQEKFAQNVAVGMTGADAYRDAYAASSMRANSIYREASLLRHNPKVAQRIAVLWEARWRAETFTRNQLVRDIVQVHDQAMEDGNYAAAIRALAIAGKMIGVL